MEHRLAREAQEEHARAAAVQPPPPRLPAPVGQTAEEAACVAWETAFPSAGLAPAFIDLSSPGEDDNED